MKWAIKGTNETEVRVLTEDLGNTLLWDMSITVESKDASLLCRMSVDDAEAFARGILKQVEDARKNNSAAHAWNLGFALREAIAAQCPYPIGAIRKEKCIKTLRAWADGCKRVNKREEGCYAIGRWIALQDMGDR